MFPKCLQKSPKCLQNVSKMSPKCIECLQIVSKMFPKCLQNVSKMAPKCLNWDISSPTGYTNLQFLSSPLQSNIQHLKIYKLYPTFHEFFKNFWFPKQQSTLLWLVNSGRTKLLVGTTNHTPRYTSTTEIWWWTANLFVIVSLQHNVPKMKVRISFALKIAIG